MITVRQLVSDLPHKRAFALAWPAILSNISVPLVGLVDTAMLGHFSDELNLGAVALGATVLGAVFWLMSFLRTGTTSLVGRALGAGRTDAALTHAQRAALLAMVMGAVVLLIQAPLVPWIMDFLTPDGAISSVASQYTSIRLASAPAVLLTLVVTGWFIGAGDTKRPLATVAVVATINITLDATFVAGLGWGAQGAAAATVIAEWAGLAVALWLWRRMAGPALRAGVTKLRGRGLRRGWTALMGMNRDIFLRTLILYAVITFVTAYGSHISPTVLAANAILMQLMYLASYGQDGYAAAAESMAAREIGEGDVPGLHRAVAAATLPAFAIGGVFTLAYLLAGPAFIAVLTSLPDVTDAALAALPWVAVLPLASAGAYLFDGVFLGSGKVGWMVLGMAVSAAIFALAWWLGSTTDDPNGNLWRAFAIFNFARGATLGLAYWRQSVAGTWLTGTRAH
ncbi:MATE family efflux transporter [Demequina oxidasica]|uniref:MATE family efflux transporter n=1 Tax=Demequina oxidasica TaxID=676199 RepID=UPI00078373EE|nr:MATE family efflux transporter [Demequina oxidasica]